MEMSLLFAPFACVFSLIGIAIFVFWIWMIIDCASNEPSNGSDKIIWILVIVFLHGLGALLYYLIRRPQRQALYGK